MPIARMVKVSEFARDDRHDDVQQFIAVHAQEVLQRALEWQRNAWALLRRRTSIRTTVPAP